MLSIKLNDCLNDELGLSFRHFIRVFFYSLYHKIADVSRRLKIVNRHLRSL